MRSFSLNRYRVPTLILFFLLTAFFAWTFAFAPFSNFVNSVILNGGTTLSAFIAAVIFTFIPFFFQPGEPPRIIWVSFAVCLWLWTFAEGIWGYLYITNGEVPVFSVADWFWLLGYIAITVSMAHQFWLITFSQHTTITWAAMGIWLFILSVISVILFVQHSTTPLDDFFSYFYLFADGVIGLLAIYLVYAFRGRALAIPWLTISSFVLSDFIYIQLTGTGVYDYVMSGISIALLADTLYVVAYLLVAWGGLEQYLLLRSSKEQVEK